MSSSPTTVDFWSFGSICVVPYEFAAPLATATGFIVRLGTNHQYLITNYHVVTGKHPISNAALDEAGHLPDRLLLALPRGGPVPLALHWTHVVIHLFDEEYNPTWIEHPRFGPKFDVVAVPLAPPAHAASVSIDPKVDDRIALFPGSPVSIIGFPHGLTGPALTAIWKTGAIASEPDLLVGDEDFFWIDANTRKGMSGSPVIARRFGTFLASNGDIITSTGPADRLLGVYAGRAQEATDMTLGRVWRWRGVQEILETAENRLAANFHAAPLGTIGHYIKAPMPTIRNKTTTIVLPGPLAPISNTVQLTELIEAAANFDERFGTNLGRLQLAAKIVAACRAAQPGGEIELPAESLRLLADCLRAPAGWLYPKGSYQIADLIAQTVSKLESIAQQAST